MTMEGSSTDPLRTLAPSWTLAGDDMLLTLLQKTHQRILSKCQEVNTKLDEMTSSLDGASIDLQNVNNKFMALSNRQFIESRVYDDDADVTTQAQPNKESPSLPPVLDEVTMMKASLAILEAKHEAAEIVDDSDSDSDVEVSVVLKPKDIYSDRPLPHVIGSQQWKNKWHAGLITEESDSDSPPSRDDSHLQYSDSEGEGHTDRHNDNTISESSSLQSDRVQDRELDRDRNLDRDLDRDRGLDRGLNRDRAGPQPTAAEIAANIASVMARTQPLIERPVTPPSPIQCVPAKPPAVYRPTQPLTGRVFPDEPPPLDDSHHYSSSSSQEDIFAEINKNKPYDQGFKVQTGISEDLFGKREKEDVFGVPYDERSSYFGGEPPPLKQKPPIIEQNESKPVQQTQHIPRDDIEESTTKKPIGGISLFGSNKHTDTIGAAILKRNIRKSSTSDESGSDVPVKQTNMAAESRNVDEIDNRNTENDIFDNLFAKSNAASNKNPKNNKKEQKTIINTEKKQNKDLFSDNIFDDVDDIFSSDIKIPSKSDKPSLFDDDDDLFTDIAKSDANISKTKDAKPQTVKTKLFDSDDELFSDIKTSKITKEDKITSKTVYPTVTTENNDNREKVVSHAAQASTQAKQTISKTAQPITTTKISENIPKPKAISIFDSDSDEEIFNFNKSAPKSSIENISAKSKLKTEEITKFQSPSLFDDDEIDELFVNIENKKDNKVDSKIDSSKMSTKEELSIEKQEQKNKEPIFNETESKIKISVETDPLLSKNNKGKAALNIETESSKSFETNTQYKENYRQDLGVSNNEKATFKPEAQSSKSIETIPTSNAEFTSNSINEVLENINVGINKLDETKAPEFNEIIKPKLLNNKINVEITPSDKLNFKTTNNQTTINSDNNGKAKEKLPKPEVPIFDGHLFEDNEPPPFEPTKEQIANIARETPIFEDPIENIVKEIPETPIFNEQIKDITRKRTKTPIIENNFQNISEEQPKLPTFKDQTENITEIIPPEVPIFDDIVTEPPIFEKAKEPKKSKNVNALFDDDSEDEALFFKKNDVISDEKPDVFSSAANFGLFIDEPPPDDFENDLFGSKHGPDPNSKDQFIESDQILTNQDIESNKIDQNPDFTEKSDEKLNLTNDLSLKTEVPKSTLLPSQSLFGNDSDEDIFSFNKASTSKKPQDNSSQNENSKNKETKQISTKTDTIDKQKSIFDDLDDNLFSTKTQHTENLIPDNNNILKKDIDTKKVGKLTTNLNINVQALMPGASPKKTKLEKVDAESKMEIPIDTEPKMVIPIDTEPKMVIPIDTEPKMVIPIDTEPKMVIPIDTEPKIVKPIDTEPKMVKSISFEEEPEREVLDNNVSKQRAKIQVKRRPSSRRARHEAVRKSTLDLDQNIDPKDQKPMADLQNSPKLDDKNIKNESSTEKLTISQEKLDAIDRSIDKKEQNKNIDVKATTDAISHDNTESTIDNLNKTQIPQNQNQNNPPNTENQKEKSTKVVYVLNDEDIFTNSIKNNIVTDATAQSSKSNEIFANIEKTEPKMVEKTAKIEANPTKIEEITTKIEETTTKVEKTATKIEENTTKHKENPTKLKENPTKPKKVSLFDSDEDETDSLFKTKPVVKKTKNTKLFDSDSDDDLFSKKRPNVKENDKIVKKSLFDDEEGDDNLFGVKPKAKLENKKSSTSKEKVEEKKEKSKTIFADPLSLFGDDDDD